MIIFILAAVFMAIFYFLLSKCSPPWKYYYVGDASIRNYDGATVYPVIMRIGNSSRIIYFMESYELAEDKIKDLNNGL